MIDHVSVSVSNLTLSEVFYSEVLSVLGFQLLDKKDRTIGFGKKYPEFWINERINLQSNQISSGFHVCLRAKSIELVDQFFNTAIANGGKSDGLPGIRAKYDSNYYAAFIKDLDGNRIEVVTFT